MNGAGRPVFAIKFRVSAAQTLFALITVIFCTPMGSFPGWMFFAPAHFISFRFI
jgi:hypothetical protein